MAQRMPKTTRKQKPTIAPELIQKRLDAIYGPIHWRPRMIALDELIFTVLTQHTSDLNAERSYDALRKAMPTWASVIEAETQKIADAIHHGGLANQKSVRIQQILIKILHRLGHFELEFLSDLPLEEARSWLTSLPGVGPKPRQ